MADNIDKVRILLLGDSGVGKTCLAHLIAQHESLDRPDWTVGCNIEVKLHLYNKGTNQEKLYFVELFDIGGSLCHKMARNVFYTPYNGIILVHDLTNRKSHENLREWIYEVLEKDGKDTVKSVISSSYSPPTGGSSYIFNRRKSSQAYRPLHNQQQSQHKADEPNEGISFDPEEFIGLAQTPILVVGTKVDLLDGKEKTGEVERTSGIAEQCGAEEIHLNCHKSNSFSADSLATEKLIRFFNKVIEKKCSTNESSYYFGRSSQITERRTRPKLPPPSISNENSTNIRIGEGQWTAGQ